MCSVLISTIFKKSKVVCNGFTFYLFPRAMWEVICLPCPQHHFQIFISFPFAKSSSSSEDHTIRQYLLFYRLPGFSLLFFEDFDFRFNISLPCSDQYLKEGFVEHRAVSLCYLSPLWYCPLNSICLGVPTLSAPSPQLNFHSVEK